MVLEHHKISTAPYAIVPNGLDENTQKQPDRGKRAILSSPYARELQDSYPLFAKPAIEGSSKGITTTSKIHNAEELESSIETICTNYPGQDVLIESFLSGREITVAIVGTGDKARALGAREIYWSKFDSTTEGNDQEFFQKYRGCL